MPTTLVTYRTVALKLINHYVGNEWQFAYDRAVRRLGLCNYQKRLISVSRHFAATASEEEFRQIVLHEIAHAIVGPGVGHGPLWQKTARSIGYEGGRTVKRELPVSAPWQGLCPAGHRHERFKRPARDLACGACSNRFSRTNLIEWKYSPAITR